jgi:hypothetical protein
VTGPTVSGPPLSEDDLVAMLRVIGESAGRSDPLDSADVSRRLGWSDAVTASSLGEARARLLVWGIRSGGAPAPRFEEIELTVQGRRLLLAVDSRPPREPSPTSRSRPASPGHDG